MTPTATPDVRGLVLATPDNFEVVLGLLATAVNAVSVFQEGGRGIDKSDLVEDFLDFDRDKYNAYLNGDRPYRYLRFTEVRRSTDPTGPTIIRAVINVPDSNDGSEERKYLDAILEYLNKQLKVDISKLDLQHRSLIARDISESNRFTCIKFLRFIWGLFGDVNKDGNGLFPQVYQARIINAGQLSRQIESGKSIFDPTNVGILQAGLVKNTDAIAIHPEDLPDFFDGRIVLFFRPEAYEGESGHVGVAKIIVIRDFEGKLKKIVSTFIEVDGNTGEAYYGYRVGMDDFRNHLFMDLESDSRASQRIIGWMFNRSH